MRFAKEPDFSRFVFRVCRIHDDWTVLHCKVALTVSRARWSLILLVLPGHSTQVCVWQKRAQIYACPNSRINVSHSSAFSFCICIISNNIYSFKFTLKRTTRKPTLSFKTVLRDVKIAQQLVGAMDDKVTHQNMSDSGRDCYGKPSKEIDLFTCLNIYIIMCVCVQLCKK